MQEFTTVSVSEDISAEEMERLWEQERSSVNLPKLVFQRVDRNHCRIWFHEDHGALTGIQNAVAQLRIIIRRNFPGCNVE